MSLSDEGWEALMEEEGLRLKAYQDEAGVWTIGWGHTQGVLEGDKITRKQAETFLNKDVSQFERCVNTHLLRVVGQPQFDSLVSFAFNVGCGGFARSTLLKMLNSGDMVGASLEFPKWNKVRDKKTGQLRVSKGLVNRRAREQTMFKKEEEHAVTAEE